jgi:D-amino-acid dehydrogenase
LAQFNVRHREALALLGTLGADVALGPELIVPFIDTSSAERFLATLAPMAEFGLSVPTGLLDGNELRRLAPALSDSINAGYVLPSDHSIDPRVFIDSMIDALRKRNVTIVEHAPITSVQRADRRIKSITTAKGMYTCDELVLAAGAGVRPLAKLFGLSVSVVPGQGYNVGLPTSHTLNNPVIFEEAHAVATPFGDRIRLGGTMEFDGDAPRFDQRRVDAIITSMRRFINLDYSAPFDTWAGGRPMSPDGMPLLGRTRAYENLVMAAGHGMYGLSLAPITALAVSELIVDGKSSVDIADFDPDRFALRHFAAGPRTSGARTSGQRKRVS